MRKQKKGDQENRTPKLDEKQGNSQCDKENEPSGQVLSNTFKEQSVQLENEWKPPDVSLYKMK